MHLFLFVLERKMKLAFEGMIVLSYVRHIRGQWIYIEENDELLVGRLGERGFEMYQNLKMDSV